MATLTRKQYMLDVTEVLAQNPRGILQGHGITPTVLKQIAARPDIMAKLAAFLYSTKYAKKGAIGLKKNKNFKISGYKNFAEFNMKGRQDVERFMSTLDPKDSDTFNNNENILVMVALPDQATGELSEDIAKGKSIFTKFDSAVRKEQKSIGGFYVTIMWGDSAIRPAEEKIAKTQAKRNAVKVERTQGTVQKLRRKLNSKERKLASKAASFERENRKLESRKNIANAHLQELGNVGQRFVGVKTTNVTDIKRAMASYNTATKRVLSALKPNEKAAYMEAAKLMAKGNKRKAKNILEKLGNEDVTKIVLGGNLTTSQAVMSARRKEIRNEIAKSNKRSEMLLAKYEAATTPRVKAQAKFDLRKSVEKTKILRARLKGASDLTGKTKQNKVNLIKRVNDAIANNIAKGASFRSALNNSLNALPVGQDVKQQIKQQVLQQVASGAPAQFSVQQAIQQVPVAQLQAVETSAQVAQTPVRKAVKRLTKKAGLAKQGMKKFLNKNNNKFGFEDSDLDTPMLAGNRDIKSQLLNGNFNL